MILRYLITCTFDIEELCFLCNALKEGTGKDKFGMYLTNNADCILCQLKITET